MAEAADKYSEMNGYYSSSRYPAPEGSSSLVPRFNVADGFDLADVSAGFEAAGVVIIERGGMYSGDIHAELSQIFAGTQEVGGPEGFSPGNTKRVLGLIAKAPAVRPHITSEVAMSLCDSHMGYDPSAIGPAFGHSELAPEDARYEPTYQVNLTAALSVGPGATLQMLHREDDNWPFFKVPRPPCCVASLLALTDFTAENGATVSGPYTSACENSVRLVLREISAASMSCLARIDGPREGWQSRTRWCRRSCLRARPSIGPAAHITAPARTEAPTCGGRASL